MSSKVPTDKLELYERLVATNPKVERKGAANPYTSLNGHMFSQLTAEGTLALRLPEPERTEFLRKYKTKLVEHYGVVRKEYVEVPETLLAKTKELSKYFQISVNYVRGLKPKPTTRRKPPTGPASPRASAKGQTPQSRRPR